MPENLITKTIPPKYSFLQNINVGLGTILIIVWIGGAFLYSWSVGRRRGPILLLATYAGLSVSAVATKLNIGTTESLSRLQENEFFSIFIFAIASLLAFVALIRIIKSHTTYSMSKQGLVVLGTLEMGAFIASFAALLPEAMQKQITGFAGILFTTSWVQALWLVLPLVVFLVGEHRPKARLFDEQ